MWADFHLTFPPRSINNRALLRFVSFDPLMKYLSHKKTKGYEFMEYKRACRIRVRRVDSAQLDELHLSSHIQNQLFHENVRDTAIT